MHMNKFEDIFISYSNNDREKAIQIKNVLESPPRNVICWMANDATITGGEDFRSRIVEAIRRCKIFLFIISKSSMDSKWCPLELSFAIMENKKIYSIQIDDSPLNELYSFKLGCSQIVNGVHNFDAAIEVLSINAKNFVDEIIEKEKKLLSEQKKFTPFTYFFPTICSKLLGTLLIVSLIVLIRNIFLAGGILDLLSLSTDDPISSSTLTFFGIFIWCLLPYFITKYIKIYMLEKISSAAKMDSPSALFLLYLITYKYNLLARLLKRKEKIEYLQKSAQMEFPPAIKEFNKFKKNTNNL